MEDDYVEAKSEWLPPERAARKIAGMANAARGEPILWIIGLDERAKRVVEVDGTDPANWWAQAQSVFAHETTPDLSVISITTDHGRVICLYFETDRAPYLVRTGSTGIATTEVPWRSGTRTRTATRSELLSILRTSASVPRLEIIQPTVIYFSNDTVQLSGEKKTVRRLSFESQVFFDADTRSRILLPRHKWSCFLRTSLGQEFKIQPEVTHFSGPSDSNGFGVEVRKAGIFVSGPDVINITGNTHVSDDIFEEVAQSAWTEIDIQFPTSDSVRRAKANYRIFEPRMEDVSVEKGVHRVVWGENRNRAFLLG